MVKLIMGEKGTGKTKELIEMVNKTAASVPGNVVCIESAAMMTYSIKPQVRLLVAKEHGINSYEVFRGFISGLYAGNYDISHIFIDNLCKICGAFGPETDTFLSWLESFSASSGVEFILTISADPSAATETMKKFL
ncbi:MAG: hypothetical protein ACI3WR_06490 [Oscillospiraceae bacterium]